MARKHEGLHSSFASELEDTKVNGFLTGLGDSSKRIGSVLALIAIIAFVLYAAGVRFP